ncbi:SDR family NAD(P)-dependent oxidoreductase [Xenorhabdus sp. BG5]|uniref:SDR family NAD(P)-dependent oxidoreductase n=1 Tax=Xenorhabdus sp. BG5 TaxID=2782014 RepID=UPI0018817113|nr:glucose 1-dehydrogenase [Xenorhabdus sp. BG5]MBE8595497.1 SDR family oxidoreductase [Xenorhabdus sp. BG5]
MNSFENKVVLITGGTAGIGLATAIEFAKRDARVLLVGRNVDKGSKAIAQMPHNANCEFYSADMSKRSDIKRLFSYIKEHYGRLDIAVNNAGMFGVSFTKITEYPDEVWDEVIATNVTGVYQCMKYEIPLMAQSGGAIVNVASVSGLKANYAGGGAYTASKHAVVGLTKSAALEMAKSNIRVNAVCPGLIRTDMSVSVFGDNLDAYGDTHPIGRIGEAEEVANAIVWLSSNKAEFITGCCLPVDGGLMVK